MTEPIAPLPGGQPRPAGAQDGANPPPRAGDAAARPEFRALLERLSQKAGDLRGVEQDVDDAAGLGRAVAQAKESLEDALSLKDQLLEAYARRQITDHTTEESTNS